MEVEMRYLTLAADYGEVAIRDERSGSLALAELSLPEDLASAIVAWNDRYQTVIPAGEHERGVDPMASLIGELDAEGVRLAKQIGDALPDEVKVRYYSEGLLREVV
jgi:hypothetical protein